MIDAERESFASKPFATKQQLTTDPHLTGSHAHLTDSHSRSLGQIGSQPELSVAKSEQSGAQLDQSGAQLDQSDLELDQSDLEQEQSGAQLELVDDTQLVSATLEPAATSESDQLDSDVIPKSVATSESVSYDDEVTAFVNPSVSRLCRSCPTYCQFLSLLSSLGETILCQKERQTRVSIRQVIQHVVNPIELKISELKVNKDKLFVRDCQLTFEMRMVRLLMYMCDETCTALAREFHQDRTNIYRDVVIAATH